MNTTHHGICCPSVFWMQFVSCNICQAECQLSVQISEQNSNFYGHTHSGSVWLSPDAVRIQTTTVLQTIKSVKAACCMFALGKFFVFTK